MPTNFYCFAKNYWVYMCTPMSFTGSARAWMERKFLYSTQNHVIFMVTSRTFWKKNHACKSVIEYLNDTEEIVVLSMRHVNSI